MINEKKLESFYEMLIEIPNKIHDEIMFTIFDELITTGDVVIEVGANIGTHTLHLSNAVGATGKVLAFEPFEENIKKLKKRLSDSGKFSNVEVFNFALSNYQGEADFKVFKDTPGICGFIERPWYDKSKMEVIKVKVDTIDDVLKNCGKVKFIKIDAEGADYHIILGARELIMQSRPLIIFEGGRIKDNPAKLYNFKKDEFKTFFDSIDYELYDTLGMKFDYRLWEKKALNDFVAIPKEQSTSLIHVLQISVFTVLISYLNYEKSSLPRWWQTKK